MDGYNRSLFVLNSVEHSARHLLIWCLPLPSVQASLSKWYTTPCPAGFKNQCLRARTVDLSSGAAKSPKAGASGKLQPLWILGFQMQNGTLPSVGGGGTPGSPSGPGRLQLPLPKHKQLPGA